MPDLSPPDFDAPDDGPPASLGLVIAWRMALAAVAALAVAVTIGGVSSVVATLALLVACAAAVLWATGYRPGEVLLGSLGVLAVVVLWAIVFGALPVRAQVDAGPAAAPIPSTELLAAVAAVVGLLLRAVVLPALKSGVPAFKRLPMPLQHIVIMGLSALLPVLEALANGRAPLEALLLIADTYLVSQVAFHATKGRFEHRDRAAPSTKRAPR